MDKKPFDVIVVGGGHAGTEAALAAARLGCSTLLVTMHLDTIGHMSCNPAIGGLGKGQLVKEIDALGGFMGIAADLCAIQFRKLNASKGPAVQSSRTQEDMQAYRVLIKQTLESQKNLSLYQAEIGDLLIRKGSIEGVQTVLGEKFFAKTVVITPGTFLNGLLHIGLQHFPGGRIGESAAITLSRTLQRVGFSIARFKTGTCPRIDSRTINYKGLERQDGDKDIRPFSFRHKNLKAEQIPCYVTYTNPTTHAIIRSGLKYSPLYTGKIKATGVRYCPSIEDKIVKFSERDRHQIFLEPQGRNTVEVYPNGVSTSLPIDVQMKMLHSIPGLEKVEMLRPGYGIEHDIVDPMQLYPTLETKLVKNLFFAGQMNGTTGYEEAAAQGLISGINAALNAKGKKPFVLGRDQAYIGVLIDDLVTKGTNEPYRMFTSRVEYRLMLREDNADERLTALGHSLGLVEADAFKDFNEKIKKVREGLTFMASQRVKPSAALNRKLKSLGTSAITTSTLLADLLKRPQISIRDLVKFQAFPFSLDRDVLEEIEIQLKYDGFIKRQKDEIERFNRIDKIKIPAAIDYASLTSISKEIREKLTKHQPQTLGQASRISGITPVAISLLMIYIRKLSYVEKRK